MSQYSGSSGTGSKYSGSSNMGADDITFDLVSILYHCLEGAETYGKYIQDAQGSGNNDMVQFFRDVQQEEQQRAQRCQQLLQQHMNQQSGSMGTQRRAA